jgi:hypothetical protein
MLAKVNQLNALFREREHRAHSIPNDNLRERLFSIFGRGRAVCYKILERDGRILSRLSASSYGQIEELINADLKSESVIGRLVEWMD